MKTRTTLPLRERIRHNRALGIAPAMPHAALPPIMRSILSRGWRRIGTDPVLVGSCFHPDNRAVSRLQTAIPRSRKRPTWHRTRQINPAGRIVPARSVTGMPTIRPIMPHTLVLSPERRVLQFLARASSSSASTERPVARSKQT